MPNQFNFFQTDTFDCSWITGDGVTTGLFTLRINQQEGFVPVNPISSLFSGVYRLYGAQLGGTENYLYRFAYDEILYPAFYRLKIGGKQRSEGNVRAFMDYTYSGVTFGTFRPETSLSASFSGQPTGQGWDEGNVSSDWSGNLRSGNLDSGTFNADWSGLAKSGCNDEYGISNLTSGFEASGLNTALVFYPTLSGSLFGKDMDRAYVNFEMLTVSFNIGGHVVNVSLLDTATVDFKMTELIFQGQIT